MPHFLTCSSDVLSQLQVQAMPQLLIGAWGPTLSAIERVLFSPVTSFHITLVINILLLDINSMLNRAGNASAMC